MSSTNWTAQQVAAKELTKPPGGGYDAFLSYSHKRDGDFSRVVHYAVETFGTSLFRSRSLRVFKDDASLRMTDDLWAEIKRHVESAKYLLVLMSPEAAASKWVKDEIEAFIEKRQREQIGLVLTAGKLPWTDADFAIESPDAAITRDMIGILYPDRTGPEPFVIDLRAYRSPWFRLLRRSGWDNLIATVASRLTGESKDLVFGRHISRLRRRMALFAGLAVGLAAAAIAAVSFATSARQEAQRADSRALAASALVEIEENPDRAMLLAGQAWDTWPTRQAQNTLFNVLTRHGKLRKVVTAPPGSVGTLRFSKDRKWLVAFNGSNLYEIFDSATMGSKGGIQTIPGDGQTFAIALSLDSRILAAGQAGGVVRLIETATAKSLTEIVLTPDQSTSFGNDVRALAYSPDGSFLAAGLGDDIVLIDIEKTAESYRLREQRRIDKAHPTSVNWLGYLPDGRLVSNGWDSRVRIWSLGTNDAPDLLTPKTGSNESPLFMSEAGHKLVGVAQNGLYVWDLEKHGAALHLDRLSIPGLPESVPRTGELSPDGRFALAAAWGAGAVVWNMATGKLLAGDSFKAHAGNTIAATFLPDGRRFISSGTDDRIFVWSLHEAYPLASPIEGIPQTAGGVPDELATGGGIFAAAFGSEGQRRIEILRLDHDGAAAHLRSLEAGEVGAMAVDPRGTLLAIGDRERIALHSLDTDKQPREIEIPSKVTALTFRPEGDVLVSGHDDGSVRFWSSRYGTEVYSVLEGQSSLPPYISRRVSGFAWLRHGAELAIATADGQLRIRDLALGRWRRPDDPNPYSPDDWSNLGYLGDMFVAADSGTDSLFIASQEKFQILSLQSGWPRSPELSLPIRDHLARSLAYDHKTRLLAFVLGRNVQGYPTAGPLLLVDGYTGQPIAPVLDGVPDVIAAVVVEPGRWLVTAGRSGLTRWSLDPGQWRRLAAAVANRPFLDSERLQYGIR